MAVDRGLSRLGGAHPLFAAGREGRPELFFIDPRTALSVIHRVSFDAEGAPSEVRVARPVNLAAEPPSFAVTTAGGEVRVRTVRVEAGARVLGEPLVFPGEQRPALAIDRSGVVAIALEGGLVRFVRCGEPR